MPDSALPKRRTIVLASTDRRPSTDATKVWMASTGTHTGSSAVPRLAIPGMMYRSVFHGEASEAVSLAMQTLLLNSLPFGSMGRMSEKSLLNAYS